MAKQREFSRIDRNRHEKSQAPGVLERWNHVATVRHSTFATVLQACAAVNIALASRPLYHHFKFEFLNIKDPSLV